MAEQHTIELLNARDLAERLKNLLLTGQAPVFYANGFIVFLGQADVGLVLQINGKDGLVLNMSFTTAKSMVEQLGTAIRNFEAQTGNVIMTTEFIRQKTVPQPVEEERKDF